MSARRTRGAIALVGVLVTAMAAGAAAAEGPTRALAPERGAEIAVQTPEQLDVALLTAGQLLDGDAGVAIHHVEIVACGGAVAALLRDGTLGPRVSALRARGVRVVACGLTVRKKAIDPARLLAGVEVVPNGLVEIVRLQAAGYYSIEL